jgi:putative membrane protein
MKTRRMQTVSAVALSFALVSCGKSDKPEPATPAAQTQPAMEETPPPAPVEVESTPTPASGTTGSSDQTPAEAKPAPLKDEQICMITDLANSAEIEQGKWAQKYAKSPDVKKFATMMVDDHTKAMQKQTKLEIKLHLEPAESPVAMDLKSQTSSALESLKKVPVEDFDRAYIDQQIKQHRELLDLIDQRLIPSASNPELITLLAEIRPTVAHHLEKAEEVQKKLTSSKK